MTVEPVNPPPLLCLPPLRSPSPLGLRWLRGSADARIPAGRGDSPPLSSPLPGSFPQEASCLQVAERVVYTPLLRSPALYVVGEVLVDFSGNRPLHANCSPSGSKITFLASGWQNGSTLPLFSPSRWSGGREECTARLLTLLVSSASLLAFQAAWRVGTMYTHCTAARVHGGYMPAHRHVPRASGWAWCIYSRFAHLRYSLRWQNRCIWHPASPSSSVLGSIHHCLSAHLPGG